MKFNRHALQQAARDALAADKAEHEKKTAELLTKHETERREWVETHGPAWLDALAVVRRAIKAGKPVTMDMLPTEVKYGRSVALWDGRPPYITDHRESSELRSLITLLEAVADDEVTSSGLSVLGISASALRRAVHHLGAATARG